MPQGKSFGTGKIPMPITCMVESENYHALVRYTKMQGKDELVRNIASQLLNGVLREMIKNGDIDG